MPETGFIPWGAVFESGKKACYNDRDLCLLHCVKYDSYLITGFVVQSAHFQKLPFTGFIFRTVIFDQVIFTDFIFQSANSE